jgi:hypothetical protein
MGILVLTLVAGLIVIGGLWIATRDTKPVEKLEGCKISTARFTITLSDRLNHQLEEVIGEDDDSKGQAMRKAVQLYIVSRKAVREGKKVGIAKSGTELATEFVNL